MLTNPLGDRDTEDSGGGGVAECLEKLYEGPPESLEPNSIACRSHESVIESLFVS